MSLTAIVLLVISAVMHAGWNLLTKRKRPSSSFFLLTSLAGAVLLAPAPLLYPRALALCLSARVGALLLATGLCMATYYAALAGAYRAGDLSVAYPLARSSPIIVVAVMTWILGRGDQVTVTCILGIVLVVTGCFLIPRKRFRGWGVSSYWNATCGLALLAAVGTAGYSMLDDTALRLLRNARAPGLGVMPVTLVYACLEALSSAAWLALFVAARPAGRASLRNDIRANKGHAALAGAAIYLTYTIVLVALAFVRNVSYAVVFRQLSIPLGAAFGILVLNEPPYRPRLAGVAVMLLGLVLVATG